MSLPQILRAASRSLVRTPSFALTVALILALGLGLSIAVFAVAAALLLRRLPVANQDRLIALWGEMRDHSVGQRSAAIQRCARLGAANDDAAERRPICLRRLVAGDAPR